MNTKTTLEKRVRSLHRAVIGAPPVVENPETKRLPWHCDCGKLEAILGGRVVQRNGSRIRDRLKCLFLIRLFHAKRRNAKWIF